MPEITGIIQSLKKDKKGLKLNNKWFSSFKELNDLKVGDDIKITYKENKGFNNIQKIDFIKPETKSGKINDTTINTILMCSKEIFIELNKNHWKEITLKEVTKQVIESYKLIEDI